MEDSTFETYNDYSSSQILNYIENPDTLNSPEILDVVKRFILAWPFILNKGCIKYKDRTYFIQIIFNIESRNHNLCLDLGKWVINGFYCSIDKSWIYSGPELPYHGKNVNDICSFFPELNPELDFALNPPKGINEISKADTLTIIKEEIKFLKKIIIQMEEDLDKL